ncbi:MAG: allantoinase AllB [Planctomycetota bacterium]
MASRLVFRSQRVQLPGGPRAADVVVEDGVITETLHHGAKADDTPVKEFGNLILAPGLVDTHVHLNDPGRADWEGFETGTRAAKAGGITTIVDMPLNSTPVTTTVDALQAKRSSAGGRIHVDVGFHAGVIPDNTALVGDVIEAGAVAAKAFMCHSGIHEFPDVGESDLRLAMNELARRNVPLLAHAERIHPVDPMTNPTSYRQYLQTRPASFESDAIRLLIELCEQTGCRTHIVHLADSGCLPMIAQAKARGLPLTAETCPHYLFFAAEDIADGRTDFKCAPPIREAFHRERLWQGLIDGTLDLIVSDHSPCPPEMKRIREGRFDTAWGGISSLQLGLSIIWTQAHQRGIAFDRIVDWMSRQPAELLGLESGIKVGHQANLFVFDPDATWVVDQNQLHHRHALTPYHGHELRGLVKHTFLRGVDSDEPRGQML